MKILCNQWHPEVWSPWPSANWSSIPGDALLGLWLFVSLCLQFFLQQLKSTLLGWDWESDLAIEEFFISFPSKDLKVLFQYVLGHYPSALWNTILSVKWEESIVYAPQNSSSSLCQQWHHHTHQSAYSIGSHICPYHNTASIMFNRWCAIHLIMRYSFPSPYFSLPIFLVQVYLNFIWLRLQNMGGIFKQFIF